jgi:homoserine kinase type II
LSVYTPVSQSDLAAWLRNYSVGALQKLEPIKSGIENTNYFVTTTQGRYVLTLFERLPAAELPFYLNLMAHLARHGIPCPAPIADLADAYLGTLNGKPAALVTRLPGRSIEAPGEAECHELGLLLARLHLAARSYPSRAGGARRRATCSRCSTRRSGGCSSRSSSSRRNAASPTCRAGPCMRTCSATTRSSSAGGSRA